MAARILLVIIPGVPYGGKKKAGTMPVSVNCLSYYGAIRPGKEQFVNSVVVRSTRSRVTVPSTVITGRKPIRQGFSEFLSSRAGGWTGGPSLMLLDLVTA